MSDIHELDRQIAAAWPVQWAKANDPSRRCNSKRRNSLRKRWRFAVEFEAFKAANPDARCLTCEHRGTEPHGTRPICDLETDFHGYALVNDENVCLRYKPA